MTVQKVEGKIELALKVYRVIRGLPHHRIAIACVIGGILILSGPFWEPYVRALFLKGLEVEVDPPTAPVFGTILVISGLLYHALVSYLELNEKKFLYNEQKEKIERNLEHDRKIYDSFIGQFPDEKIKGILSFIDANDSFLRSEMQVLDDAEYFLLSTDNEFIDEQVSASVSDLLVAFRNWKSFCNRKFFPHGPISEDTAFALQPNWNIDRGGDYSVENMRKYDELSTELHEKTESLASKIDDFRRTAKRQIT